MTRNYLLSEADIVQTFGNDAADLPSYSEAVAITIPSIVISQPGEDANSNDTALAAADARQSDASASAPTDNPPVGRRPSLLNIPPEFLASSTIDDVKNPPIVHPTTFSVADRFIYTSHPNAPPLFELSHSFGFLRDTDHTVRFERLEYTIHSSEDDSSSSGGNAVRPSRTVSRRHLYNLRNPTLMEASPFRFYAESTNKRSRTVGLKEFPAHKTPLRSARRYEVHKAVITSEKRLVDRETVLFSASPATGKGKGTNGVVVEWSDDTQQLVAREVRVDNVLTLAITVDMDSQKRDVLVSSWIMRMWWDLARGGEFNYFNRKEAKRAMHYANARAVVRQVEH